MVPGRRFVDLEAATLPAHTRFLAGRLQIYESMTRHRWSPRRAAIPLRQV